MGKRVSNVPLWFYWSILKIIFLKDNQCLTKNKTREKKNMGWDSYKAGPACSTTSKAQTHKKERRKPSGPSQFINVHRSVGSSINHTPPSGSTSHPHSINRQPRLSYCVCVCALLAFLLIQFSFSFSFLGFSYITFIPSALSYIIIIRDAFSCPFSQPPFSFFHKCAVA